MVKKLINQLLILLLIATGACGTDAAYGVAGFCLWTTVFQDANPTEDPTLTITFVANEGFLIRGQDQLGQEKSVLIDAFVKDEYYGYGAIPAEHLDNLLGGKSHFERINLALTTHVHLDHFQVDPAVAFLKNNPTCAFLAAEQVVLKIRQSTTDSQIAEQVVTLWPEAGKTTTIERGGVQVTALRLRHTNPRNYEIQNLGFIIQIGEKKIIHVGDAELRAENFISYDVKKFEIDVAILPVWFFQNPKLIEEHIGARQLIAAHIAVEQAERVAKSFAEKHPDVLVPTRPMQTWTIQ